MRFIVRVWVILGNGGFCFISIGFITIACILLGQHLFYCVNANYDSTNQFCASAGFIL